MSDMPDAIENSRATTVPVTSSRGAEYCAGHAPMSAAPAEAGGAEEGGKYVYCIIRQEHERSFGEIGIGGPSPRVHRSPQRSRRGRERHADRDL